MNAYDLTHLRDDALLRGLDSLAAQDRATTAQLIAHIAEVDHRRLYAPAGYASMHAYCVERLHLSEGAAWKRIHVAKKARQYPEILEALADGRVHLSGLVLLVPHLTDDNLGALIGAATHRRKAQIERMLAERFPEVEVLRLDEGISALRPIEIPSAAVGLPPGAVVPKAVAQPAPLTVPTTVAPITAERFSLQVTIDRATHDQLRYAQELASAEVPTLLRRAIDLLVAELEKKKFSKVGGPRSARPATNPRTIPAEVERQVWARDGGKCTFVAKDGHRCEARAHLEYDHIVPVALGGEATVDNIRLRCRTHNQLEAERIFGKSFVDAKRGSPSRN